MKTVTFILLISSCVALSMAHYKPLSPGRVHAGAASPRSGYVRPDQEPFAFAAQFDPAAIAALQHCANQQCGFIHAAIWLVCL